MKLFILAKPNSKHPGVTQVDGAHYEVAVKEPPLQGRANEAVCRALAQFLNVPPSRITLVSGHRSKRKILELEAQNTH